MLRRELGAVWRGCRQERWSAGSPPAVTHVEISQLKSHDAGASTNAPHADPSPTSRRSAYVRLGILASVLALAGFAAYRLGIFELRDPERLAAALRRVRDVPALPVMFVLAYALASTFGVPGTAFTLAGGAIFGTVFGSLLNWAGATISALGAYTLARRLGSGAVRGILGRHARTLDALGERAGFGTLFRLRLIPVVPFNALNFAAGLAPVPFRSYALSTALGIIPGTVIYTYFADSLIAGVMGARNKALLHVAVAGALLIALSFGPALVRRVRRGRAHLVVLLAASLSLAAPAVTQDATADHGTIDALLRRNVVDGLVDYDAFARDPAFRRYLNALDQTDPSRLSPADRLALWINAYNAYTIHLVNTHGERESIRNINRSLGFLSLKGPWKERLARVGGRAYSLDEIEQNIIRKRFREPRIHFALVCAALGCPPLRNEAYRGDRLDSQLEEQARVFLREFPANNRVHVASRTVYVSPIFTWYRKDFSDSPVAIGRFLAGYYPAGPERQLLESGEFVLRETEYDWNLNRRVGGSVQP